MFADAIADTFIVVTTAMCAEADCHLESRLEGSHGDLDLEVPQPVITQIPID